MPTDATSVEELHAFVDEQGHRYDMRLFENGSAWTIKAFDVQVLVAQVNCLVQDSDLFLADLHVFEAARHPLRRIDQIKGWLGFDVSGTDRRLPAPRPGHRVARIRRSTRRAAQVWPDYRKAFPEGFASQPAPSGVV